MDAYSFYLNTFRYVMNADADNKATWCDIFKYLPCLRQMLSCCVCGSIIRQPQGPTHGVCLHHVCSSCVGGTMRLKPSCSWCKDHNKFEANKKLRILVLCFQKLCAYISSSKLGTEISKASVNGHEHGNEAEPTLNILREAEDFNDNYMLTPAPTEIPKLPKSGSTGGPKLTQLSTLPMCKNSQSGLATVSRDVMRKRGRPKRVQGLNIKSRSKSNASFHVKRLKKKALISGKSASKSIKFKKFANNRKTTDPPRPSLLISQRPHRDLSGKYSIGQLWRETFLEESTPVAHETEVYPDSGIEVGNSSDQDHNFQPPNLSKQNASSSKPSKPCEEKPTSNTTGRDTRLHPVTDDRALSVNDVTSTTSESVQKPRLTLKISKKQFQKLGSKGFAKGSSYKSTVSSTLWNSTASAHTNSSADPLFKRRGRRAKAKSSFAQNRHVCRCARFKQPNQLTCFGQKCPCYRERKACVDCLCNGCKNPRKTSETAPPLMHVVKETNALENGTDPSMPRLSPIPRM